MSTNVRMIIAMAVSVVIVILWSMFILPKNETSIPVKQETATVQDDVNQEAQPQEQEKSPADETENVDSMTTPEEEQTSVKADSISDIVVETDLYKVMLSNQAGGSVKSWILKGYEKSFSKEPFDLLGPEAVRGDVYKPFSTVIRNVKGEYQQLPDLPVISADVVDGHLVFSDGTATVIFTYQDQTLGRITKEITFNQASYSIKVEYRTDLNKAHRDSDVMMIMGGGIGDLVKANAEGILEPGKEMNGYLLKKPSGGIEKVPSLVNKMDEIKYIETNTAKMDYFFVETKKESKEFYSWAGLENNYFMTLAYGGEGFFPVYQLTAISEVSGPEKKEYFTTPYIAIKTEKDNGLFKVYCGPKDFDILQNHENAVLKDVISFGMFSFISRPALWLMQEINKFINNYGFTIILLTIFINILTLPLIIKQRKSMGQMQLIQPQIKALQAKYKVDKADDIKKRQAKKQKLNEEMMALYKEEGVNPMGGCMPMLIQLPILFALLDMFRVAIELRKAPFILWWDNLSAMDPTYILPIVMAGAMFLSMKLTPSSPDQQNGAMKFMPFLFAFMLASMPSGLVLYWTTSNLFSLGTQVIMNQVSPVKKAKEKEKVLKSGKVEKKK